MLSWPHLLQTALFVVEFLIGYALMLSVMTYNAWLLLAVVIGSACGYLICKMVIHKYTLGPEATAAAAQPAGKTGSERLGDKRGKLAACEGEDPSPPEANGDNLTAVLMQKEHVTSSAMQTVASPEERCTLIDSVTVL